VILAKHSALWTLKENNISTFCQFRRRKYFISGATILSWHFDLIVFTHQGSTPLKDESTDLDYSLDSIPADMLLSLETIYNNSKIPPKKKEMPSDEPKIPTKVLETDTKRLWHSRVAIHQNKMVIVYIRVKLAFSPNSVKHAAASRIWIEYMNEKHSFKLAMIDNSIELKFSKPAKEVRENFETFFNSSTTDVQNSSDFDRCKKSLLKKLRNFQYGSGNMGFKYFEDVIKSMQYSRTDILKAVESNFYYVIYCSFCGFDIVTNISIRTMIVFMMRCFSVLSNMFIRIY
jgi:hypothetical protein